MERPNILVFRKRKENTKNRYEMMLTGGGLPDKKEDDPILLIVDDAAPFVDVEMTSLWDSTAVFERSRSVHQGLYLTL